MIKILEPDKSFSEKVEKYGHTDGLLALGLFFIIGALYAAQAALEIRYPVIRNILYWWAWYLICPWQL